MYLVTSCAAAPQDKNTFHKFTRYFGLIDVSTTTLRWWNVNWFDLRLCSPKHARKTSLKTHGIFARPPKVKPDDMRSSQWYPPLKQRADTFFAVYVERSVFQKFQSKNTWEMRKTKSRDILVNWMTEHGYVKVASREEKKDACCAGRVFTSFLNLGIWCLAFYLSWSHHAKGTLDLNNPAQLNIQQNLTSPGKLLFAYGTSHRP